MYRLEGNADAEVRRLALTLGVDILRPNSDGLGPYIDIVRPDIDITLLNRGFNYKTLRNSSVYYYLRPPFVPFQMIHARSSALVLQPWTQSPCNPR